MIFIARQHVLQSRNDTYPAMGMGPLLLHAERDIMLTNPSVCPCVCPSIRYTLLVCAFCFS